MTNHSSCLCVWCNIQHQIGIQWLEFIDFNHNIILRIYIHIILLLFSKLCKFPDLLTFIYWNILKDREVLVEYVTFVYFVVLIRTMEIAKCCGIITLLLHFLKYRIVRFDLKIKWNHIEWTQLFANIIKSDT